MFKKILTILAATASMALVGCQSTAAENTQPVKPEQTQEAQVPQTPQEIEPEQQTQPVQQAKCDASIVQAFIGKEATTIRIDTIREKTQASVVRILMPNQVVTLEFNFSRVNVHVNDNYIIQDITCG